MADIFTSQSKPLAMEPTPIPHTPQTRLPPPLQTVPIPQSYSAVRNGHLNMATFSPVNHNGHFEFDRVLKSGIVHKRTRKTKVGQNRAGSLTGRCSQTNTIYDSNGNLISSSSAPIFSQSTSLPLKSVSSNRSLSPTSAPSPTSKTQRANANMSSAYFLHPEISTYRLKVKRKRGHG